MYVSKRELKSSLSPDTGKDMLFADQTGVLYGNHIRNKDNHFVELLL